LVPTLVIVTVAPGNAPRVASVTCPTMPDEADSWAETAALTMKTSAQHTPAILRNIYLLL
jgi:hypothetical protein